MSKRQGRPMRRFARMIASAWLLGGLLVAGCASQREYTASNPAVRVLPSKGWTKPGTTGEEAYFERRACDEALETDPTYLKLKLDSDGVRIDDESREADRRRWADNIYGGRYWDTCMKEKGFTYGKYTSEDQIYVPPPPPEKGYVKPGVSYVEATDVKRKCLIQEYSQEYLDKCMAAQGFVYRELTEDELPPCWYAGVTQLCRPEARPER